MHSTPVRHAAVTSQSVSHDTSRAGVDSATAAAADSHAETTSMQRVPIQQRPVQHGTPQQSVQYQPAAQLAGPAGLGSQVGGNCNPKCS